MAFRRWRRWTADEDNVLRTHTVTDAARILGAHRSLAAITTRRWAIGLNKTGQSHGRERWYRRAPEPDIEFDLVPRDKVPVATNAAPVPYAWLVDRIRAIPAGMAGRITLDCVSYNRLETIRRYVRCAGISARITFTHGAVYIQPRASRPVPRLAVPLKGEI